MNNWTSRSTSPVCGRSRCSTSCTERALSLFLRLPPFNSNTHQHQLAHSLSGTLLPPARTEYINQHAHAHTTSPLPKRRESAPTFTAMGPKDNTKIIINKQKDNNKTNKQINIIYFTKVGTTRSTVMAMAVLAILGKRAVRGNSARSRASLQGRLHVLLPPWPRSRFTRRGGETRTA